MDRPPPERRDIHVRLDLTLPIRKKPGAKEAREEAQERREDRLDAIVAAELQTLAAKAAWEEAHPQPEDPYATKVRARIVKERGDRFLLVGVRKPRPGHEEFEVELLKKLGD